jgi:hypothetical protein
MKKFSVSLRIVETGVIEIEAENEKAARKKIVEGNYKFGDIELGDSDVEVEDIEEVKE